jgi:deaminated glutathione amidase
MNSSLRIAAAQFPVSGDITRNARYIHAQIKEAAKQRADVVHFPETALSGYAPQHFSSLANYPRDVLDAQTLAICKAAKAHNLWIVLGSMRQLDGGLPSNCLLVISAHGEFEGIYVKQRLYAVEKQFYSPGAGPCVVIINGFKCGFLICYDNCYPELYDAYRRLDAGLIFHSFHNAANRRATSIKDLMLANLIVRAADNRMWISASNSSKRYSPLSACIVRPDGSMRRARRHATALVVDDYPNAKLGWTYDNSKI